MMVIKKPAPVLSLGGEEIANVPMQYLGPGLGGRKFANDGELRKPELKAHCLLRSGKPRIRKGEKKPVSAITESSREKLLSFTEGNAPDALRHVQNALLRTIFMAAGIKIVAHADVKVAV